MAGTDALGRSLALIDGYLVFVSRTVADAGQQRTVRALAEVAGMPNLVQALTLRVLSPLGDDMFNTGYGFDAASYKNAGRKFTPWHSFTSSTHLG